MTTETEKLYAGKFKSIEDLEQGYKNAAPVYDENEKLKKQLEDATSIPHTYINPGDVELEAARLSDIQARAKETGMTQAQYERFVRSDKQRLDTRKATFENAKKEVGEETLNVLTDYVDKNYPKELKDSMINTFIGNKAARDAALAHRSQLLNSRVPGTDKIASSGGYRVSQKDVVDAYEAKEKNRGDLKARQHYMNVLAAKAEQDKAS